MKNEQCWILLGKTLNSFWCGKLTKMTKGKPTSVTFDPYFVLERDDLLGFFHSHPGMLAIPSGTDHDTMKAWVCSAGKPLICCIIGKDGLRAYQYNDDESPPIEIPEVKKFGKCIIGSKIMYKVRLTKIVLAEDDNIQYHLQREIELPFIPFVGLELYGRNYTKSALVKLNIDRVIWVDDTQQFECLIEIEKVKKICLDDYGKKWKFNTNSSIVF